MNTRKEILISPTTRIEGHGRVSIILDETGNVSDAYFYATEIRGFEYFLRGMDASRLPFIISRICGVCSTAHVLASVKAIENIYEVEISETADKLRKLLLLGQVISNHSLIFFFLILPDFWFPMEENPSKRNAFQIIREKPEIGRKAITLRAYAAKILDVIGKRDVHIVSVIPGGLITSFKENERKNLLSQAEKACIIAQEAVEMGKELFDKSWDEFRKAGDYKSHYMALTRRDKIEFYDGLIRVLSPKGWISSEFATQEYMKNVEEERHEWTYAKFARLKTQEQKEVIVQVGPIARINVNNEVDTEFASKEMKEFKRKFGSPAFSTILFDYARLIELLYACEKAKELLEDETITRTDTRVKIKPKSGKGIGVIEAPRGLLAHEYLLTRNGRLKNARLIIPTQVNNMAININLKDAAKEFIRNGEIKQGLLNKIEMVIRAYDPCIKCAARTIGNNIKVEIRNAEGKLLKSLS